MWLHRKYSTAISWNFDTICESITGLSQLYSKSIAKSELLQKTSLEASCTHRNDSIWFYVGANDLSLTRVNF